MPKIVMVSNLPVTTFVNATVRIEDGPDHTLHQRIAEAAKAGNWERAHGKHAEDYENLTLELNENVLAYPLWSFDILSGCPATPMALPYGALPERAQFDAAWRATLSDGTMSFKGDHRAGTQEATSATVWELLRAAAADYGMTEEDASSCFIHDAGDFCAKVLGSIGIHWE